MKIKIGPLTYRVKRVSRDELPENEDGNITSADLTIRIDKELKGDIFKSTLWHEVFHAINCELEHETVEFLAQFILMILKDNPEMRKV